MIERLSEKEMEKAFYAANAEYDGLFYTGVATTGIFCRPSCRARKPLRKNIAFFQTVQQAMFSRFRACKKCSPLTLGDDEPAWLNKLLASLEDNPHQRIFDSQLKKFGVAPATVRRYFLKNYHMTFQAYCRAKRMGNAFQQLKKGETLDNVALDNGYESLSGFREAFSRLFGMPPAKSKQQEEKQLVHFAWVETPLGAMVAGASDQGVCLLEFSDRRMLENQFKKIKKYFGDAIVPGKNKHLEQMEKELNEYFAGKRKKFECQLDFPGTEFQKKVWNGLLTIPHGKTTSYQELAKKIGHPGAVRALGTANGMNRISIIIPCHRVINKGGALGGYGGGKWRKQRLLELEGSMDRSLNRSTIMTKSIKAINKRSSFLKH